MHELEMLGYGIAEGAPAASRDNDEFRALKQDEHTRPAGTT
jgi:hypothetical protein